MTMPACFIGHGNPMNALERNRYTDAWRTLGASIPKPRAIVVVSAHWFLTYAAVTAMARPRTIHDFYGFPDELFAVDYPRRVVWDRPDDAFDWAERFDEAGRELMTTDPGAIVRLAEHPDDTNT